MVHDVPIDLLEVAPARVEAATHDFFSRIGCLFTSFRSWSGVQRERRVTLTGRLV